MKYKLSLILFLPLYSFAATSDQTLDSSVLTGDPKLACEAILCFSSSASRPGECNESISKYFSITRKKASDTVKARRSFLQLCPASNESGMPELINDLVDGADRCSANLLNSVLKEQKTFLVCDSRKRRGRDDDGCENVIKYRINSTLPSYCQSLKSNQYTDFSSLHYTGNSEWQSSVDFLKSPVGKWVD
ncbi:conjugal transfer protein [Dickeya dadantii]|nr:conjugal transfer protein [Dickeya dadantii]NPE67136.1 conjugal transfer protein [Dickeya dadantii]